MSAIHGKRPNPLFLIARTEIGSILALEKSKTFFNLSPCSAHLSVMKFHLSFSAILVLGMSVLTVGCKSRNTPTSPIPPAPVPPAQYGQAPGDIPMPPDQAGGRFGYNGANAAPGTTAPPPAGGMRDIREIDPAAPKPPATSQNPPSPPPASSPSAADMPYANAVAGNPLVVTLPGANASLGQISVEKYDSSGNPTGEPLKRGTQVQIPDPNNPGKKIYFKVP